MKEINSRFAWMPPLLILLGVVGFVFLPYWKMPPNLDQHTAMAFWGLVALVILQSALIWWVASRALPEDGLVREWITGDRFLHVAGAGVLAVPLLLAVRAAVRCPITAGGDEAAQPQYVSGMLKQVDALLERAGGALSAVGLVGFAGWVLLACLLVLAVLWHRRRKLAVRVLMAAAVGVLVAAIGWSWVGPSLMPWRPAIARYPPLGKLAGMLLGCMFGLREIGFRMYSLAGWAVYCAAVYGAVLSLGSRRAALVTAVLAGCVPVALNYAALAYMELPFLAFSAGAFAWLVRYVQRDDLSPLSAEMILAAFFVWVAFLWKDAGAVAALIVMGSAALTWLFCSKKGGRAGRDVLAWLVLGLVLAASVVPYFLIRLKLFKVRPHESQLAQLFDLRLLLAYPSGWALWFTVPVCLLALAGLLRLLRSGDRRSRILIPCVLWIVVMDAFLATDVACWVGYVRFGVNFLPPVMALAGVGVSWLLDSLRPRASLAAAAALLLTGLAMAVWLNPFRGERPKQFGTDIGLPYGEAMKRVAELKGLDAGVLALKPLGWLSRPDAFYAYRAGLRRTPVEVDDLGELTMDMVEAMFQRGEIDAVIAPVSGPWPLLPAEGSEWLGDDPLVRQLQASPALETASTFEYGEYRLAVLVRRTAGEKTLGNGGR